MNIRCLLFVVCSLVFSLYGMDDQQKVGLPVPKPFFCIQNETNWLLEIVYTNEQGISEFPRYLKPGSLSDVPFKKAKRIEIAPVSSYGITGEYASGLTSAIGGFASRWGGFSFAESTKQYCLQPKAVDSKHLQDLYNGLKEGLISQNTSFALMRVIQDYDQEHEENVLLVSCDQTDSKCSQEIALEDAPTARVFPKDETAEQKICDKLRAYFKWAKDTNNVMAFKFAAAQALVDMAEHAEQGQQCALIFTALFNCCDLLHIPHGNFFQLVENGLMADGDIDRQCESWQRCITVVREAMQCPAIAGLMHQEDVEEFIGTANTIIRQIRIISIFIEDVINKYKALL
jgi:hypothetical protein